MLLYSPRIIRFIGQLKGHVRDILKNEVRRTVHGDRFHSQNNRTSYPLKIVVYNNKKCLGYFDPNFLELGFHRHLMKVDKATLLNIIRHELAHYLICNDHGPYVLPHSIEFRNLCKSFGWSKEVYESSMELDLDEKDEQEESTVLRKIKKLMALTTSSNSNEAEQALIKSQQLLQKHNIDAHQELGEDEPIVLKRILKQKRDDRKMRAIAQILETFYVNSIYNRCSDYIHLEISGLAVNVEIADYIASILQVELDKLWKIASRQTGISHTVAKNSFFTGLALGYCKKVEALERNIADSNQSALMVIKDSLIDIRSLVYKGLRNSTSKGKHCPTSASIGQKMGHELTLNPGLKYSDSKSSELKYLYY